MYLSCSTDTKGSCNTLQGCFEKALRKPLRKFSGPLLGQRRHPGARLAGHNHQIGDPSGAWLKQWLLISAPLQTSRTDVYCIQVLLSKKHRHKVMVYLLSKEKSTSRKQTVVVRPSYTELLENCQEQRMIFFHNLYYSSFLCVWNSWYVKIKLDYLNTLITVFSLCSKI